MSTERYSNNNRPITSRMELMGSYSDQYSRVCLTLTCGVIVVGLCKRVSFGQRVQRCIKVTRNIYTIFFLGDVFANFTPQYINVSLLIQWKTRKMMKIVYHPSPAAYAHLCRCDISVVLKRHINIIDIQVDRSTTWHVAQYYNNQSENVQLRDEQRHSFKMYTCCLLVHCCCNEQPNKNNNKNQ